MNDKLKTPDLFGYVDSSEKTEKTIKTNKRAKDKVTSPKAEKNSSTPKRNASKKAKTASRSDKKKTQTSKENRQGKPRPGAVRFNLVLDEELRDAVEAIAYIEGRATSAVIEEAVRNYREGHELGAAIDDMVKKRKSARCVQATKK